MRDSFVFAKIYRRPDYVVVSHDDLRTMRSQQSTSNPYKTELRETSARHDRRALVKSCEILTFLICDAAYVTPENFEYCIHCLRTFIEVTIVQHTSRSTLGNRQQTNAAKTLRKVTSSSALNTDYSNEQGKTRTEYSDDDDGQESIRQEYQTLTLQLLELMQTLYTRASQIFKHLPDDQTRSSLLWYKCWCPILQGQFLRDRSQIDRIVRWLGTARLCCDPRRPVRSAAFGYLQRSILLPELHVLPATEWESVFNKVLFPLLIQLLETKINIDQSYGIEETRVRVSQLLCRIFLQHLTPLLTLPTFTGLWMTILDFIDKYSKIDQTDMVVSRDSSRSIDSHRTSLAWIRSRILEEHASGDEHNEFIRRWSTINSADQRSDSKFPPGSLGWCFQSVHTTGQSIGCCSAAAEQYRRETGASWTSDDDRTDDNAHECKLQLPLVVELSRFWCSSLECSFSPLWKFLADLF